MHLFRHLFSLSAGPLSVRLLCLGFLACVCAAQAQTFARVKLKPTQLMEKKKNLPSKYLIYSYKAAALDSVLEMHKKPGGNITLSLPDETGALHTFLCVPSQVMPAALQAKYPGIRSWSGKAKDDPACEVRVDRNDKGFLVMGKHPADTWFIRPIKTRRKGAFLIVYAKKDAPASGTSPYAPSEPVK